MARQIALLRGVNVGGNTKVEMARLREGNYLWIGIEFHDVAASVKSDPNSTNSPVSFRQSKVISTGVSERLVRQGGHGSSKRLGLGVLGQHQQTNQNPMHE